MGEGGFKAGLGHIRRSYLPPPPQSKMKKQKGVLGLALEPWGLILDIALIYSFGF